MEFDQDFLISARKPIVYDDELVYGLAVNVVTTIETTKDLDNTKDILGLFIDKKHKPNIMSPLLLVPLPDSQLLTLSQEELKTSTYTFTFYKDVYKTSMKPEGFEQEVPYVDTVAIEEEEFYQILSNDLHFNHSENSPCRSIWEAEGYLILKVKHFSEATGYLLEFEINEFIEKNNITEFDVSYSVDDSDEHNALVKFIKT